ncbi:MAG: DUF3685 domain-containing protein [Cyanobacteriota bacterium]|nr:DUF3685 domain-containing protein [Cyanobacteriota bacterium]
MAQHLLLLAEPLLAEGLKRLLAEACSDLTIATDGGATTANPALVLWCPEAGIEAPALERETRRLSETWPAAALLIVLPQGLRLPRQRLLQLPAEGLLEAPDSALLLQAIETLRQGGRCVKLKAEQSSMPAEPGPAVGLGQWLLISGQQQIDQALWRCEALLTQANGNPLSLLVLQGQRRELLAARRLLVLLHGPVSLAWGPEAIGSPPGGALLLPQDAPNAGTSINLLQRNAEGSWQAITQELRQRLGEQLQNHSGQLLALEALLPERRRDLLLALLDQLDLLRRQLANSPLQPQQLHEQWVGVQSELRRQALGRMASPYVRLPFEGQLRAVAETLLRSSDLEVSDPELPEPQPMLSALVLGQPLLVEGRLLAPDEPLAVLHLQQLVANWLLRNGEQVAAQTLACCAAWPELRRYLLVSELLSTRNLERLRNQLNAQQRWAALLLRPVAIYESRRAMLNLEAGRIAAVQIHEPRDRELRQLSLAQQLVTLALESRDALAPQLQSLLQGIGQVVVVVLTQVVGRAIGLVGRGIVQGMGRSRRASQ